MIIAFSGPMGAGKTTSAEILRFMLPQKVGMKLIKFAQPLYDMQELIYRRIDKVYKRPENFKKDRKLLQFLGTEWARQTIKDSIFVDIWEEEVKNERDDGGVIICDDCRFDNECEAIKRLGGIIVKINSTNHNRAESPNGIDNHVSEKGISDKYADYIVNNYGSLDEFDSQIRSVFKKILSSIPTQK